MKIPNLFYDNIVQSIFILDFFTATSKRFTKTSVTFVSHSMGKTVTLATCTLNQWAMDFKGNLARISESKNCRSLPFPELGPNKQVQ